MRIVHLIAELKEDNKISIELKPVDMGEEPEKFCEEAEYILGSKRLMRAIIQLRGQEFAVVHNPLAKMPPVLHTPDSVIVYGSALIGASLGKGMIAGLSGGGEKLLYSHLQENMQETIKMLAEQKE